MSHVLPYVLSHSLLYHCSGNQVSSTSTRQSNYLEHASLGFKGSIFLLIFFTMDCPTIWKKKPEHFSNNKKMKKLGITPSQYHSDKIDNNNSQQNVT